MSSECVIPDEVLEKYHIYKGFGDDLIGIYQTFLIMTDYKITKLYEAVSQDLEHMTEIINEFKVNEAEAVYYRQLARKELGGLLDEMYTEQEALDWERDHEEHEVYYSQMDEGSNEEKAKDQEEHSPINE